ncbi:MAG: hypothetical protein ACP5IM_00050 [Candidatus Bathyarchaeia archaeon]
MSAEDADPQKSSDLRQSVIQYFRKKGYKMDENVSLEGYRGIPRNFDLIIQKGCITQGVWIKDWKRTIGINVIINFDKASEEVGLPNPHAL